MRILAIIALLEILAATTAFAAAGETQALVKIYGLGVGGSLALPVTPEVQIETEISGAFRQEQEGGEDWLVATPEYVPEQQVYSIFVSAKYFPIPMMFVQAGPGLQLMREEPGDSQHEGIERPGVTMRALRYGFFAAAGFEIPIPAINSALGGEVVGLFKPVGAKFQSFEMENQRLTESEKEAYKESIRHDLFKRYMIFFWAFSLR